MWGRYIIRFGRAMPTVEFGGGIMREGGPNSLVGGRSIGPSPGGPMELTGGIPPIRGGPMPGGITGGGPIITGGWSDRGGGMAAPPLARPFNFPALKAAVVASTNFWAWKCQWKLYRNFRLTSLGLISINLYGSALREVKTTPGFERKKCSLRQQKYDKPDDTTSSLPIAPSNLGILVFGR